MSNNIMDYGHIYKILSEFENVHKTESEFWIKYESLSDEQKHNLSEFYPTISEMDLFEQICKFWNVN